MTTTAARSARWTFESSDRTAEKLVRSLLEKAGVQLGGSAPHDIRVHDSRTYGRWVREGTMGMGESYMDGWWDSPALDQTIAAMLLADLRAHIARDWRMLALFAKCRLLNLQDLRRARKTSARVYDVGADVYEAMLDERMLYTCGYWRDAEDLASAQTAKLELVCRKIGLRAGMRVLDLGCGWGGFAEFAAREYGAHVTGVALSRPQIELARRRCEGLPVDLRVQDYREVRGTYDAVVSMGLMEHVGAKNYRRYMEIVRRCLDPDGIAVLHTIAGNKSRDLIDPWVDRYIFPNALLPSIRQIGGAMEGLLVLEDVHNFGPDYDRTLMAWQQNFEDAWPELKRAYDERFRRMWRYYLLISAAGFRARDMQLFQIVMTRTGRRQPDCRLL